jgi:hypothetical protein
MENGNVIIQLQNDLDVRATGSLVVRTKGDVYLGAETDLKIDRIESGSGDIRLKVSGNITNNRDDGGVNLTGNALILDAPAGSVGSSGKALVTDLGPAGLLTAAVAGDLFLEERSGDLTADGIVSQNGSVALSVSNGSADIDHVSAPGSVSILANGPLLKVRLIDTALLDLRNPFSGGAISVDRAGVGESVTARSDTIRMGSISHKGEGALRFDVRGGSGPMAGLVEIGADSASAIGFDHLYAEKAAIDAQVDRLSFLDTRIGSRGDFFNSRYHVILDNRNRAVQPGDLQLYATYPFYLEMFAEPRFMTNAIVIKYDPGFIVNDFSTENSVVGLTQKMLWTGKRENRLYYDPMEPAPHPWQRGITPPGGESIDVRPGSVGIGADDAQLKIENVDVVYQ